MNKVWATSDLHWNHKNIVKFTNRGKETNEEDHTEWLIDLWNSTVHKSDIVFHLGDLSFNKNPLETIKILDRLNGNKVLIKGNHDHSDAFKLYSEAKNTATHVYLEKSFDISGKKQHVCMFHFPLLSWHKQGYGSWALVGHSHGNCKDMKGKQLDVGIDNAYNLYGKHCFFDLEMIKEYMDKQEIYVADTHRENL